MAPYFSWSSRSIRSILLNCVKENCYWFSKFLLELNFVRNCQEIHGREYFLTLFHFTSFEYFPGMERFFSMYPVSRSVEGFYFLKPAEGIKVKTSTDSPCGFCGRVALSLSNYIFALTSVSLRYFPFFVRDDRNFCKSCFRQGQIVSETPMFDQYLF